LIILLCGPIGAGKTSIAERLAEELEGSSVISSDRFRRRVYDRLVREAEVRLGRARYIILDATFYREAYRRRIMDLASRGERVLTVFLDCPLEICLERNRRRGSPVPERAVKIIWREFERPEAPDIHIDTGNLSIDEAVRAILGRLKHLEPDGGGPISPSGESDR
jgi:predicted kinase